MVRTLDQELLTTLEARWHEQSPALLDRLAPGLRDVEIDRLTAPLGYSLPEEARRWFRWHDGSTGRPVMFARALDHLSASVDSTLQFAKLDETWVPGWLKVMDDKPYVLFDCRGAADAPVPVWHLDYAYDPPTRPVFDSIGDMVAFWIELINAGQLRWSPQSGGWIPREPTPEAVLLRITGVPTD